MKAVMAVVLLVLFCVAQGCAIIGGSESDEAYALLHPKGLPGYCASTDNSVCIVHCPGGVTHEVYNLSALERHDTYDRTSLCRSLRR